MKKLINRRHLIAGLGALGAGVALSPSFPAPAIASGIRQWKMVLTWQKALPGLGSSAIRLAERITSLSGGKLEIKVYGGGELVPALSVFDAVAQGTAEMGHSGSYYWLNKAKAAAFFCSVPGGMTMPEQKAWVYFGGGQQLWEELYGQFGLIAFHAGNSACQMGGWFNKELRTLADIQGLKMRIPGLGGEVFTRLGGSAQVIPPQELYIAMQSGVIDALEWVGPWNDLTLGFHRVSKYYYGPAFQEGASAFELMINRKAYDSLPEELQRMIKVACAVENDLMTAEFLANNLRAFGELKHHYRVDIRNYPTDIANAFFKTSEEVVAGVAEESALARKIYDSYHNFRARAIEMMPYTDQGFMNAREHATGKKNS